MKKYYTILLCLFSVFFLFSGEVNAANSPFVGTCTCFYAPTLGTKTYDCSSYYVGTDSKLSDFPLGVCDEICSMNNATWYGNPTLNLSFCDGSNCKKLTAENSKDCVEANSGSNSNQTSNSTCKYNYSQSACAALGNGTWNSSTGCCDLTETCWYHLEQGLNMQGGTLYWQVENPCTIQANIDKYPSQKCERQPNLTKEQCSGSDVYSNDIHEIEQENAANNNLSAPILGIDDTSMTCAEILGPNGVKVVKLGINILRIAGAIIALVNAMLSLLPAVMSKDADGLKKAGTKCVYMAIILALIFLFPTLLKIIGKMFEWDISCLV